MTALMNPAHLRWATRSQNLADMATDGTMCLGERNPQAILTSEQVLAAAHDPRAARLVAQELGVSASTIKDIRSGRGWSWLTGIARP